MFKQQFIAGQFLESAGNTSLESETFMSDIWMLPCQPKADFAEEARVFEVPGTSELIVR